MANAGPSWEDLVDAIVATRTDHATARFDEELAAAEAAGTIDAAVARTLRWWQRESVRAVADHVTAVLPGVIEAMTLADRDARDSVSASGRAWDAAMPAPEPVPVPVPEAVAPAVGDGLTGPAPEHHEAADDRPIGTVTSLPTRAPEPVDPPHRPGPGFTSSLFATPTHHDGSRAGDTGAPHARLLAGGLTVLGDGPTGPASAGAAKVEP